MTADTSDGSAVPAGSDADGAGDEHDAEPSPDTIRVLAGDCAVTYEGDHERVQRGFVVVLVKPDRTVLVHDARGYQPVAWLTRPDEVTVETDPRPVDGDGDLPPPEFAVTARTADQTLTVVSRVPTGVVEFPASQAGVPVGACPDCGDTLVRAGGEVACLGCAATYGLPSGATVRPDSCEDCGLPTLRVERGDVFEVCLDWSCESLTDRVAGALDGRWDCPDCGSPLQAKQARGRVFLGCADYPDCETTFSVPAGVVDGECACGLPAVETASGRRCLDATCPHEGRTDGGA